MKINFLSLSLFTSLFVISACSSTDQHIDMQPNFQVGELAIYMRRGALDTVDFEQYKLSNRRLYGECGVIRRGRHIPAQQQLFDLNEQQHETLMQLTWQLLELSQAGQAQIESPGSSTSMFDPGYLTVKVSGNENALQIKTSVDGTAEPTTTAGKLINQITRRIRANAKPGACGNSNFYGLTPLS